MDRTTTAFVDSLVGVRDWNRQLAQIGDWASAGRTGLLREIGETVSGPSCPGGVSPLVRQAMLEAILRSLALTPSYATAEAALVCLPLADRLVAPYVPRRPRELLASVLAFAQTAETLQRLFKRHGADPRHREVLACLAQEALLRGTALPPAVAEFYELQLVAVDHPLAWLPLHLLPDERLLQQYLPRYGARSTFCTPAPASEAGVPGSPVSDRETAPAVEWAPASVSDDLRTAISAAVHNWSEESNGVAEVGVFHADRDLAATRLSADSLLSLPMGCMRGVSAADIAVRRVPLAEALSQLFSAASTGGAYNSGEYGAYGRLKAWRSVAGMVGADAGASVGAVAGTAERCCWMLFDVNGDWFYHVAWDLGLLALRSDARTVVVLAATDTD